MGIAAVEAIGRAVPFPLPVDLVGVRAGDRPEFAPLGDGEAIALHARTAGHCEVRERS